MKAYDGLWETVANVIRFGRLVFVNALQAPREFEGIRVVPREDKPFSSLCERKGLFVILSEERAILL